MTETLPYDVPLGDEIVHESSGALVFTNLMCSEFAGGRSGLVYGHVYLTRTELAFRPILHQLPLQMVTVPRDQITRVEVVQPKWFRLIDRGPAWLHVTWSRHVLKVGVEHPERWRQTLKKPAAKLGNSRDRCTEALKRGDRAVGSYADVLADLAFPQGFWHIDAVDDLYDVAGGAFETLNIDVPAGWIQGLDLAVEATEAAVGDYGVGVGIESEGRREQIRRICEGVNESEFDGERRFYQFAEDMPRWDYDEPVWLWLTEAERDRLLELNVLTPLP